MQKEEWARRFIEFKCKVHEWNARRPHLPDVHDHPRFKLATTIIVHVGFFAKALLYGSMGMILKLNNRGFIKCRNCCYVGS
jgi:hypothetical protein